MADYTPEQEVRVKDLLKLTDYYQILGVGKDYTSSQLKKAYLKLAKEFHPDRNKAPGSTKATQLLVKAYTVLSDPEKRQKYDADGGEEEVEEEEDVRDFNFEDFENFENNRPGEHEEVLFVLLLRICSSVPPRLYHHEDKL